MIMKATADSKGGKGPLADVLIDASDKVLGRMGSLAAKELLKGRKVVIVNAEKCVVSGNPQATAGSFRERIARGDPYHGPFYPKAPDRIVRRVVRGMLPKSPRGREALRSLRVFISLPGEYEGREFAKLGGAENRLKGKFLVLEELVKKL
jgi:large subunit ribosomal protein L13